ncbi:MULTISPECIES: hypothetical protein [Pseudomonas]|uniref:hypothetical protein n=1 Tax=Pseudomonas TaxID=286 RepID=UPI000AD8C5F8|nr:MULTISPECIES: hypothetical protein [Pseudomonas]
MSDSDLIRLYEPPLSDKEAILIGRIIALWGALEYVVFEQTLATFEVQSPEELPPEMNNLSFVKALGLWKSQVADVAEGEVREVLKQLYTKINNLKDSRNAMIHGMWTWSTAELGEICTRRVSNKKLINMSFPAGRLADLHDELAVINFNIRYPGGSEDFVLEIAGEGSFISRRALRALTGDCTADYSFQSQIRLRDRPE